jgi:stage II sporulation protein D
MILVIVNIIIMIILPTVLISSSNLLWGAGRKVKVYNTETEEMMTLRLEKYIKGVLAAEMPNHFALEALKAQTVAIRTYTLKQLQTNSYLTTDINRDQSWVSRKELLKRWGLGNYLLNWFKISAAVDETAGIVLSYEGELISAVYHSTSGGVTASAHEVWGTNRPYLAPVTSKYETVSPYYSQSHEYKVLELCRKLGVAQVGTEAVKINKKSSSGRVTRFQVGSNIITGREVRQALELPSTRFKIKKQEGKIEFLTSGFGHGVGLSQYGAQGMAQEGYNYIQILKHYYQGVEVNRINQR